MEVKKAPKADLEGKKSLFFEVGLVLSLAILLFAFEWKSSSGEVGTFQTVPEEQVEEEIIPITQQMLKPPPPPPPAPKLTDMMEIVDDASTIDEDLEILDAEDESENKPVENPADFGEYGDEETGDETIFSIVEDLPSFPLGDPTKWVLKHIDYPTVALENGIQGRVFTNFVIERDGSVTNIKITRGVDPLLDAEAIRVLKSMPKWKAGKQRGKPVRCSFNLQINFQLQN